MDLAGLFRRGVRKGNLTSTLRKGTKHRAMRVEPLEQRALLAVIAVDSLGDGPVNTADGNTTLRDALALAADVANPGADEITFAASLGLDTTPGTITLSEGVLEIDSDVEIQGPGASQLTIDANGQSEVFAVDDDVTATLDGLTITGGIASRSGETARGTALPRSSIYNGTGTLTITDCEISDNYGAVLNMSGTLNVINTTITEIEDNAHLGLYNDTGTLTVANSTISGNAFSGIQSNDGELIVSGSTLSGNGYDCNWGGGITVFAGTLELSDSTVAKNSSFNDVGGIYVGAEGTATVSNSVIVRNSGDMIGGIRSAGALTISNSIVVGNEGDLGAGGVACGGTLIIVNSVIAGNDVWDEYTNGIGGLSIGGEAYLFNTIVAGNLGPTADILGTVTDGSNNLVGDGTNVTGLTDGVDGNLIGTGAAPVDPLFVDLQTWEDINGPDQIPGTEDDGPLGDYHLLAGSPARDVGSNLFLDEIDSDGAGPDVEIDLDGSGTIGDYTIAVDLDGSVRVLNSVVDMGAYESSSPPELDPIGNQETDELVELTFTATATDADVPAETLTFSLVDAPAGATIGASTGDFSWTPTEEQDGVHTFTVMVSDGTLTDEEEITVTVDEVNVAPELGSIGNQEVDELVELTFTASATDADVPAQSLGFSLVDAPAGAAIDGETGDFSWTPTEEQDGEYTFTVKVSDGELTTQEEITVTVAEVNVAPELGSIGDQEVDELVELTFTATATDADLAAQQLTFSLVDAPSGAAIDGGTGEFSWTPTEEQDGEHTFTVMVSDGELTDEEEIIISVGDVNLPPSLELIGDQEVDELVEWTLTVTATDDDMPEQSLEFSLVGAPAGAAIDGETGVFSWTPTEEQDGEYTFTVMVSDGEESDEEEIKVTVAEVNVAPVLSAIGDQSGNVRSELTFTASATDTDVPKQSLAFSLADAPTGAAIDESTGEFSWTPTADQAGDQTFTVVVSDGESTGEEVITVTVSPNQVPALDPIGDQEAEELVESTFTVTATDDDEPAQTLEFSLIDAPSGAAIDSETGVFSWTPTEEQDGPHTFTVVVSDGEATDEEEITVTVAEVNVAPELASIGAQEVDELVELTFTATATDADVPAQALEFSLVDAPAGAAIDGETGEFSWTPAEDQDGQHTFTVVVSDGALTDSEEIVVTVADVNVAPVAEAGDAYTANEGGKVTLDASQSSDPDGDVLEYAWDFDGDGEYDDATGPAPVFSVAEFDVETVLTVGLQVSDPSGVTDTDTCQVTVVEVESLDLGEVGFAEQAELALDEGNVWYQITAAQEGDLTVVVSTESGSATAALYDTERSEPAIVESAGADGTHRFDYAVQAGETYLVKVMGDSTNASVAIANLITTTEKEIQVSGTSGADVFEFAPTGSYLITINGVEYHFDDTKYEEISFTGSEGNDTVILTGGPGDETARFHPDHGTFGTDGYLVTIEDVTAITAHGGGGEDSVFMYDSAGDDTFVCRSDYSSLSGEGYSLEAFDFTTNYGYATTKDGGNDVAIMEESTAGKDKFKFDWPSSDQFFGKMYGGGVYYNRAKNFEKIEVTMEEGKNFARLFDSGGDDTFYGQKNESRLTGEGFDVTVSGYDSLAVYASKGIDIANLEDSEDDDTTRARSHKITLWGDDYADPTYKIMARRFDEYHFERKNGGDDRAKLHDTVLSDHATASGNTASLSRNDGELDLLYEVIGFEWVRLYGSQGEDTVEKEEPVGFELVYSTLEWDEV